MRQCTITILLALHAVVFARPIALTCIAIDDGADDTPSSREKVEAMMPFVNKVFAQVAMSFEVASFSTITNATLATVLMSDTNKIDDICNITNETGGVEVYFVESVESEELAFTIGQTVIMGSRAGARTLAHELGHVCGLQDIYDWHLGTTNVVTGPPSRSRMPDDWGWYGDGVSQAAVIRRLLMYGYSVSGNDVRCDISYGDVYGLRRTPSTDPVSGARTNVFKCGMARVGFKRHGNRHPVSE